MKPSQYQGKWITYEQLSNGNTQLLLHSYASHFHLEHPHNNIIYISLVLKDKLTQCSPIINYVVFKRHGFDFMTQLYKL